MKLDPNIKQLDVEIETKQVALYEIKVGETIYKIYRTYTDEKVEKEVFATCLKDKIIAGRDVGGSYVVVNLEG